MITYYLDVLEENILIGLDSEDNDVILEILSDFYGSDFEPCKIEEENIMEFVENTVIVTPNLVDEAFISLMVENNINIYVKT